jgi:Kef-type K+ transport system membrane component KefB
MDQTAGPILEIGVLLLGAVGAGWLARRVGLPAIIGYLVLGLVVSPFTPGYVADHDQLQLLADLGVVLLLFEVGIEVDLLRIRSEQRGLILAAPAQTVITTVLAGLALSAAGLAPIPAAIIGLSIALSSSSTSRAAGGGRRIARPRRHSSAGARSRTRPAWSSRPSSWPCSASTGGPSTRRPPASSRSSS